MKKIYIIASIVLFFAFLNLGVKSYVLFKQNLNDLPSEERLLNSFKKKSGITYAKVLDQREKHLGSILIGDRDFVSIEDIPKVVKQAFLSAEDKFFYKHIGINVFSIVRAFFSNLILGRITQGASTITQQLARIEFLNHKKTYSRKIKEITLALTIEKKFSKDRILELYLNSIFLGNHSYGVSSAAKRYFGKYIKDINIGEAALLASLPKAPSYYAPHKFYKRAKKRQKIILARMLDNKVITREEYDVWLSKDIKIIKNINSRENSYFLDMVRKKVKDKIISSQYLGQRINIYTSYDQKIHKEATQVFKKSFSVLSKNRDIKHSDKIEGSFIVIDKDTSAVYALQGGSDYLSTQFNRALYTKREMGSLFLPFYFTLALENGYNIMHSPEFNPSSNKDPYFGDKSLYETLLSSDVYAFVPLFVNLGTSYVSNFSERLGFEFKNKDISLSIGKGSASLLEVVSAYSSLFNRGIKTKAFFINKIATDNKELIYLRENGFKENLFSQESAFVTDFVLRHYVAKHLNLSDKDSFSAMTGVSDGAKDIFLCAKKSNFILGLWYGAEYGKTVLSDNLPELRRKILSIAQNIFEKIQDNSVMISEKDYPKGISFGKVSLNSGDEKILPFVLGYEPNDFETF